MDIKKVLKNIKNKGIRKTWEIHLNNNVGKRYEQYKKYYTENLVCNETVFTEKPYLNIKTAEEKKAYLEVLFAKEEELKEKVPKLYEEHMEQIYRDYYEENLVYNESIFMDRPFLNIESEVGLKIFWEVLFKKENELKKKDSGLYKRYMKKMKAVYVKARIPQVYEEHSQKELENKVIFMENGNSPSPSGAHLAKTIKKQKLYTVCYEGLQIRQVSFVQYYENALRFIENMATAKAVFLSTANDLLSHFDVRKETKIIQLWHGVGVFKKVGYSTVNNKNFGKSAAAREEYNQYRNYSYVTIPAPEQSWIFEEAMRIDKEAGIIVPVGVSRTDVFYDENYIKDCFTKLYEAYPQMEGKKILFYGPTFRGAVANAQAPDNLDIDVLGEALSDEYVLIIKHHGLSKNIPEIPEKWKNTFAFDLGKDKVLSIEGLLAVSDVLITDYSSIAFEFAIMEKPIVFFAYDLEDYIDKRGMYYDYDEITPGPVCKTNEEMVDYLLHLEERFDKEEMAAFKQKHVGCCDGHSTERTIALIES